jgi:SAM-dependent methyltransferase
LNQRAPVVSAREASAVGEKTLDTFAAAPRLNAWLYSKLAGAVRGDVLEVGSGVGNLSRHIVRDAERVVLSDVEPRYLEVLRRELGDEDRVAIVRYDLEAPPPPTLAARRFDAIVAVNVVEHIENALLLVQRLAHLLKPGGRLLVYVPACPFAYGTLDRALGHHVRYTPAGLAALLAGAGLVPDPPRYFNFLGLLGWLVSGLLLREQELAPRRVALFERLVPLARLEDHVRLPAGLGVYTQAVKPAAAAPPGP